MDETQMWSTIVVVEHAAPTKEDARRQLETYEAAVKEAGGRVRGAALWPGDGMAKEAALKFVGI